MIKKYYFYEALTVCHQITIAGQKKTKKCCWIIWWEACDPFPLAPPKSMLESLFLKIVRPSRVSLPKTIASQLHQLWQITTVDLVCVVRRCCCWRHLSVCPSVCLSHSWGMLKQFKISKYFWHHTIEQCFRFLVPDFCNQSIGIPQTYALKRDTPVRCKNWQIIDNNF